MSKIIYVVYYETDKNPRHISLAGTTMMEYVAKTINNAGYNLTMFSAAQSKNGEAIDRTIEKIDDKTEIVFTPCFKRYKNVVMRFVQKKRREKSLYKELDSVIENGDTVVVYHALGLIAPLEKLQKKKRFKLVLQVCEIYSDVTGNTKMRDKEISFIEKADSYIFSSGLLEEKLNKHKREYTICLGTYKNEEKLNSTPNDEKIHVVYAGTFDPTKGGALAAIESTKYLDENYHMHILGMGTNEQVENVKNAVNEAVGNTKCGVTYDGCLDGDEYKSFLQGCHIGLSTQNPNADFNATSFPSKILVYLANGLSVVSVKIPAVQTSSVGSLMNYYENQTPKEIADAIKNVDLENKKDSREIIKELDKSFVEDMARLLS